MFDVVVGGGSGWLRGILSGTDSGTISSGIRFGVCDLTLSLPRGEVSLICLSFLFRFCKSYYDALFIMLLILLGWDSASCDNF